MMGKVIYILWTALILGGACSALEMHFEPKDGGFFLRSGRKGDTVNVLSTMIPNSKSGSDSSNKNNNNNDINTSKTDNNIDIGLGWGNPYTDDLDEPSTVNAEHFTVLPSNQPVSIHVMYGPFSTKQTVPIRLLVPDPLDSINTTGTNGDPEMIPPLDLSAHLVTPTIPKDNPILRVLFHAGQTAFGLPIPSQNPSRQGGGMRSPRHRTRLCLVAEASRTETDVVTSSCSPDSRDSTCLAELTLPIHWWPQGGYFSDKGNSNGPVKPTKVPIQVSYAVYEPENNHCNEIGLSTLYGFGIAGEGEGKKRIQIQPLTPLKSVTLVDAQRSYKVVKAGGSEAVKLLVPEGSVYPHAKFYVPVFIGKHEHQSIVAFIMRARVKSGLRIIGIEPNPDSVWNITTDFNPRRTHATITAVRKFDQSFHEAEEVEEAFNWILETSEDTQNRWDGGRVIWILRYVVQPASDSNWMKKDPFSNFGDERYKLTTRLQIQKDDVQAVVPIAKTWEVVNTAILNGKQTSHPLKIFTVSRAGKVADVTLQASCKSLDESVLKVSSSCTSVYVDGSELRGSMNATVVIKYGMYEGAAHFLVWTPEFPLDIYVADNKLNQIKGWRVPTHGGSHSTTLESLSRYRKMITMQKEYQNDGPSMSKSKKRKNDMSGEYMKSMESETGDLNMSEGREEFREDKSGRNRTSTTTLNSYYDETVTLDGTREDLDSSWTSDDDYMSEEYVESSNEEENRACRSRFQHSRIEVYGRFLARDHDSGRTSYFISRKTFLKVTDLVSDYLRVADSHVAIIKRATSSIQGLMPGRTEIQVVSPISGRVLGTKEVRMVNERVSIKEMKVKVISGVQLSLFPNSERDNEFVAETAVTSKLSAKYQEALLDIQLHLSDNTWVKLDEVDQSSYSLIVDSLEPDVVELPPIQNSLYPRIIAVSEGAGPIMRVSMELNRECRRENGGPLARSIAQVEVNFTSSSSQSEFTQNDSNQMGGGGNSMTKVTFRKSGRGSKQSKLNGKKNWVTRGLGVIKENDITGIPLRDDSSKGSHGGNHFGPIRVGFEPEKGWTLSAHNTPLEVAMYVLLGVFSVAILVFVASCFVYASRVKKREGSHHDDLLGVKPVEMNFAGTCPPRPNGCTTNAHDWVWLGRTSLSLHPSLEGHHHAHHTQLSQHSNKSTHFELTGTNPMRIITNPHFESVVGASTPQSSQNPSHVHSGLGAASGSQRPSPQDSNKSMAPPPLPPKPSHIDSSTYSVKQTAHGSGPRGGHHSTSSASNSECPEYRPPIPPHRNLSPANSLSPPLRTQSLSCTSPQSTSHPSNYQHSRVGINNLNIVTKACKNRVNQEALDNEALDLRRPNIVDNPMSFIDEEEEEEAETRPLNPPPPAIPPPKQSHHRGRHGKMKAPPPPPSNSSHKSSKSVKLDLDYDQLMEYFDSLKESEA